MSSSGSWFSSLLFSGLFMLSSAQPTSLQMCSAPDRAYFYSWAWIERTVWLLQHVSIHVSTSPYRLPLFLSSLSKSCSACHLLETISHRLLSASDFQSSVEVPDYSGQTEGLCSCSHRRASCLPLLVVRRYIFILIVSCKSGYWPPLSTLSCLQILTGTFPLHYLTQERTPVNVV